MADYIDREDVMHKINQLTGCGWEASYAASKCYDIVQNAPSADVVPVVRCKECRKCDHDEDTGFYWCTEPLGALGAIRVLETFYCAFGEKKEEANG